MFAAPAPVEGAASTSQGRSYGIFQKALQRRNVIAAVAAARELQQLGLAAALELTFLIARKRPAPASARSCPVATALRRARARVER
jgi:hypothetical protein